MCGGGNVKEQLVRALWLVNFADRILLYSPLNSKVLFPARPINLRARYNKCLTNLVFTVCTVQLRIFVFSHWIMTRALRAWAMNQRAGKNSVRNLEYGPRTRLVRGMFSSKQQDSEIAKFKVSRLERESFRFTSTCRLDMVHACKLGSA